MKVLDFMKALEARKKEEWDKHVFYMAENAENPQDRIFFTELKLAYLFDVYYKETGSYHPNDPANIDDMDGPFVKI